MRDLSLFLKFSFFISGIIVIIMTVSGLFVIYRQSTYVKDQLKQSGRSLLEQYAYNVELALRQGDDMILHDATQAAYRPKAGIEGAFVLNGRKRYKAHNEHSKVGEKFLPDNYEILLTKNLQIAGRGKFLVGIGLDRDWINEALYKIRSSIFEVTLFMVLIGLIGAGMMGTLMSEPIEKLTASVEKIAEGNYGHQIEMSRGDEIGVLAQSINDMSQKILEDRKELIKKQKMENELEVGREIQSTFLPESYPELTDYTLDVVYRASRQVGGDLYDFVELSGDRVAFFIADASGKGVPGALLMANTIATVRAIFGAGAISVETDEDLKNALGMLNSICLENFQNQSFVTFFVGLLDYEENLFQFARCGHNPLLRYDNERGKVDQYNPGGVSIGVVPSQVFEQKLEIEEIRIGPGDMLYQYSDGITEVKKDNGEMLGVDGVCGCIEEDENSPPKASRLFEVIADKYHESELDYEDDVVIVSMQQDGAG